MCARDGPGFPEPLPDEAVSKASKLQFLLLGRNAQPRSHYCSSHSFINGRLLAPSLNNTPQAGPTRFFQRLCTQAVQVSSISADSSHIMSDTTPTSLTQLPEESNRHLYSKAELLAYFSRIDLPEQYYQALLSDTSLARTKEQGLPLLEALCRHHTCNVPFENLILHYSANKKVTLDLSELYTWFVTKRRGGRCMENNSFFATVLRSLGYQVRNCRGRMSRAMSPYLEVR